MSDTPQTRSQDDGPWCWQNKAARRLIRQRFSEAHCIASALSIYDALCELASDAQAEEFVASTPTVATTAGVGTRTAQGILPKLAAFGIIRVQERTFAGTNMDAPSVYTLLNVQPEASPHRNGCAPVSNGCASVRSGRKQSSLRTSEESGRISEESENNLSAGSSGSEFQPAESIVVPPPASPPAAGVEPKAKKAKAKKAVPPPDPRFKPVVDGYCAAYLTVVGKPYVLDGGKDGAHLKAFLSRARPELYSADAIVSTARAAMEHSDSSPYAKATKFASSLSTFCTQFPTIQAELNGAKAKTSGQTLRRYAN